MYVHMVQCVSGTSVDIRSQFGNMIGTYGSISVEAWVKNGIGYCLFSICGLRMASLHIPAYRPTIYN